MSPSDQKLISRLRALPEAGQAAELKRACSADPDLRGREEEFLAALTAAVETPSTGPVLDALQSALTVAPAESPGTRLGSYRLVEKIGEGGFSTVWMAEQSEPVHRMVAVKILKLGMDTEEVITRFEAERQALALMDHPNIAQVFDAGATDTGRPYFVMELVRGTAITRFCDEHHLPAIDRLRLFISVCQAVQHAHQKGVIHRDIKPSNILITIYDGVPVPKVIDFGIAKATGPRLTEKTIVTQFHAFLGTPAYTSPEQMEMSALNVDTRSDIYSLGVLLYELLCGRLPFDTESLATLGLEAVRRSIMSVDPLRPSVRLAALSLEDRTTLALLRGTDPRKLSQFLDGDLDWIVMRCLEKDRARRYDTATGLARDIQCFLEHEPVVARPPHRSYLLRKFVLRHRFAVGAAGALAFALAAGAVLSTWQAVRATQAEREQVRLREAEETLREEARQQAIDMRQRAYASDMKLLQQELANENRGRAVELLNRQRPAPGMPDLRGWEWRYLWQACRSESTAVLNDQPLTARHLAVSADGNWLALVRLDDSAVELWDLRARKRVPVSIPYGAGESSIAFSPTEPLLAIAGQVSPKTGTISARLVLWSLVTHQVVREWPLHMEPFHKLTELTFSADGTRLFAALGEDMVVSSVSDGQSLLSFESGEQNAVAISSDFSLMAVPGTDAGNVAVRLIQTATGKVLHGLDAAKEYVDRLEFSPDGRILATAGGSREKTIRLWDTATGELLGVLEGHHSPVEAMVFWPDGRTLASGSIDQTIRLWDVASRKLLRTFHGHEGHLFDLKLLPDGKTLVSSAHDGTVRMWDTSAPAPPSAHSELGGIVLHWRFEPDGRAIIALDGEGHVQRWHGNDFEQCEELLDVGRFLPWPLHACIAPDRPLVAILGEKQFVKVWNWETKTMVREFTGIAPDKIFLGCAGFTDEGTKLLLNWGTEDLLHFGLSEWDVATGQLIRTWPYAGPISFPLGWYVPMNIVSPDSRHCIISWSGNPWAQRKAELGPSWLLDLDSGAELPLPGAAVGWWNSATFSNDGRLFAMPADFSTTIWEVQPLQMVRTLRWSGGAAFSMDGRRLALGDGSIWDTTSWEQVMTLIEPSGVIFDGAFSPDDSILGQRTQFGALHLWRAPTWEEIDAAEAAERNKVPPPAAPPPT